MDVLHISWDATVEYCEQLAKKIDYKPDLLVGLSRGGLVPLRLLSDILGINSVGVLGLSLYKGIGKTFDKPKIVQDLAIDITGKKILIIDDVADSGRSLVAAKAYFEGKGAKEIKIATLHYKPNSIFKPDYFVATTTAWIAYPWEKHEIDKELKNYNSK